MKSKVEEGSIVFFEIEGEFKNGLTWRSVMALLYSLFVFSPAVIYLNLVTIGGGLRGSAIEYATLLLFSEIAALYGNPITPQEAAIIFGPATTAGSGGFLTLIYRLYFTRSPLLRVFGIDPNEIPWWYSPPPTSPVWELRTFIHPDWIPPILIMCIVHITSLASGLFFGLLARELFIEGERLPFPMQQITVAAIDSLSKRGETMKTLSLFAIIGFSYGIIYYTIPIYTRALGILGLDLIPKPWADFTKAIEPYLPGASFGIATSLTTMSAGIIIPQELLVVGIFIGSALRFLIINPLLIQQGWSLWATVWTPGMNLTRIYQFSQLYYWLNPLIGVGFAVGFIPLIFNGRIFIQSLIRAFRFKKISKVESEKRVSGSPISGGWMILLFSIGTFGALLLDLYLIPDFPIWVLLLYEFIIPFLVTISAGRMYALTGTTAGSLNIPYFYQLSIIASGYPKIKAWFLPLRVDPGTGWLRSFAICSMTKTTIVSWIKASLIAWPLSLLVGFIYMQIFWQLAPIPSEVYPTPGIQWPIEIINQCVWITRPVSLFDVNQILYWALGFGALMALLWRLGLSSLMIGVASGMATPIPTATMILIGLILKRILMKFLGRTWILRNKAVLLAGLALGEGLAAICGISLAIAVKSAFTGIF